MHPSARFAQRRVSEHAGLRRWTIAKALRLLVLAVALGLGLVHTTSAPPPAHAISLPSCGFRQVYGPFGAVVGREVTETVALTTCLPDPAPNLPEIDWGGGGGWETVSTFVHDRGDCVVGCRIGGSHTYVTPGLKIVKVRYFFFTFEFDAPPTTVYVNTGPPSPGVDTAGWMGALNADIGNLPLSEIVIPATHDTGAIGFTRSGNPVSPDFPPDVVKGLAGLSGTLHNSSGSCSIDITNTCADALDVLGTLVDQSATHFVTGGVLDGNFAEIGDSTALQAAAQDTTIAEQLNGGIRLLDIRLCVDNIVPATLRFCHSLYGGRVADVLPSIKQFILNHPSEIVIFDMHNTTGLDAARNDVSSEPQHEALIQSMRQIFSTDGSCATQATCLLVSNSFSMTSTPNQILAAPGRLILLDGDQAVVQWDKTTFPNNRVVWDENSQTASTFIDGLTDFNGFRSNLFQDAACRCNAASTSDTTPHPALLFPLGMDISPDANVIKSELLQRLIDGKLDDSIGPAVAAAVLGAGYYPLSSDVTDGAILQQVAAIANPLNLNALYGLVLLDHDLRNGINWLSTDFFEQSDLVPISIALNKIAPTHFVARLVVRDGSTSPPAYQPGALSKFPVDVQFTCVHGDGSVDGAIDVQHVNTDTPTGGIVLSPRLDCATTTHISFGAFSINPIPAAPISVGPILVSITPPVVTRNVAADSCSVPGRDGWCRGQQAAGFSATDAASGVDLPCLAAAGASCSFTQATATEGSAVTIASGPVTNVAGNTSPGITAGPFKVDHTAPVLTIGGFTPPSSGWVTPGPATDTLTATDTLSGVADITCTDSLGGLTLGKLVGSKTASATRGWSLSGDGVHLLSCTATDVADNATSAQSLTVKIDATPPATPILAFTPNGSNGWFTVATAAGTVTASDATSGVTDISCQDSLNGLTQSKFTSQPGGGGSRDLKVTGDGSHVLSCTATDLAGNTSPAGTTGTIKIDSTKPAVTFQSRAPVANAAGWASQDVNITWSCTDATSGPSSPTVSKTTSGEGAALSVTGVCVDLAGNSVSDTQTGIKVDKTPPIVSLSTNAASYSVAGTVVISCSASDALSLVASSALTGLPSGNGCANVSIPVWQFALGANTLTVSATDNAGNTVSASAQFTVKVSPSSLGTLTTQLLRGDRNPQRFVVPLNSAAAFSQRGQSAQAIQALKQYITLVQAATPSELSPAQSQALIQLAQALEQTV